MAAEQTVAAALGIEPGLCAIIGSGGKTSLLLRLAEELPGRVIVCTSTRILPPPLPLYTGADEAALAALLQAHGVVCTGTAAERGKLAAPALPFAALCRLADYVLVEADGSKHLPLKAHLAHEPVIPAETGQRILVVGVMGHIAIQVILNVAVVTNTIPNTGISLPFISYGGSSVMFLLAEIGIVFSVGRGIRLKDL